MTYQVLVATVAEKDLATLPGTVQGRIIEALTDLATDPRPPSSRELAGRLRGTRRLRVGDYRVGYTVEEETRQVKVWAVGHRRALYARLERRL